MPQVQNPRMNVPAILQIKLSFSVTVALYYEDIRCQIVPSIMNWSRIRQFRSYTTSCKEWEDPADLPACSKDLSIIHLLELVIEHLRRKLGVRKIPFSYVTRVDSNVPTIGTISTTFPYSEGVEYFHEELINRASQNHPKFADDNGMVLDVLIPCLKTTRHMSDLKPFQKRRHGRGSLAALKLHNMGNSKWESIVSES